MSFEEALKRVAAIEGGYSDNSLDRGGVTNFGVTERLARALGYDGEMRDMPRVFAEHVYRQVFWDALRLEEVDRLHSSVVAEELFESAVNLGVRRAGLFLQRVLNAFNHGSKLYADVVLDGEIGPITMAALQAFHKKRGAEGMRVLLAALNALQGEHYILLAESDPTQEEFVYGWVRQRVAFSKES